jgi:GABA(A) receptor-associated protein
MSFLSALTNTLNPSSTVNNEKEAEREKPFRELYSLDKRKSEFKNINMKYPDRIPVIVERATHHSLIPQIDKKKYLISHDLTMYQVLYTIRRRLKLSETQAIFVFINNRLPPMAATLGQIYKDNKEEDGFLYITYNGEDTFG